MAGNVAVLLDLDSLRPNLQDIESICKRYGSVIERHAFSTTPAVLITYGQQLRDLDYKLELTSGSSTSPEAVSNLVIHTALDLVRNPQLQIETIAVVSNDNIYANLFLSLIHQGIQTIAIGYQQIGPRLRETATYIEILANVLPSSHIGINLESEGIQSSSSEAGQGGANASAAGVDPIQKQAQQFLSRLDSLSDESHFFEQYAQNFSSRLEAAIEYLGLKSQPTGSFPESQNFSIEEKIAQADDRQTAPAILERLSKDAEIVIRRKVAWNPATPTHVLEQLAKNSDSSIRKGVACNESAPTTLLLLLATDMDPLVRQAVACNKSIPLPLLESLAKDQNPKVRRGVAANPIASVSLLQYLSEDEDALVRKYVVLHPGITSEILNALAKDPNVVVREAVAAHPTTPISTLIDLTLDLAPTVSQLANQTLLQRKG